jgi:hypothetical protein
MSSAVEQHVIYGISNAPLRQHPYPHLYLESVFPEEFYRSMRDNWPDGGSLVSLADSGRVTPGAYPDRFILPFADEEIEKLPEEKRAFWRDFGSWFLGERFRRALMQKFTPDIRRRFGSALDRQSFSVDSLIVRDRVNYRLGPHTDATSKLLSLLFYCPDDDRAKHLGTSIYEPRDPDFRCAGGPHYSHDQFIKVATMEYRPNSLFAFFKTDNSFHGVEPIKDDGVLRDLLLYDIRVTETQVRAPSAYRGSARIGWGLLKGMFGRGR